MKTLIEKLGYTFFFGTLATAAFSISLFEITSSVFIGLWLVSLFLEKRRPTGPWVALLGLYVLLNALSVTQAQFSHDSLKGAFRVLRWGLLTLAVTDAVDSREKFSRVLDAVLAVVAFIAVDALIQKATGVEILRGRGQTAFFGATGRVTGPFPHANDFSAYLCLAVFAYAGALLAAGKSRGRTALLLSGLALTLACLALTYSRGAWLAVVAGLLFWAVRRRSFWPAALVAVFVLGAYAQSPFLFKDRIGSLAHFWDGTVSERRVLWSESVDMIRARPVLGFGVNTYSSNIAAFKDPMHRTDRQYAHNGYLQIAAETGLIGLAAFLAAVFYFLAAGGVFFAAPAGDALPAGGQALAAGAQGIYLGVVALLLQSLTDTTLQSLLLAGHLWMWIGLGWSAHRLMRLSGGQGPA